uniref:uncharacterized protein LOC120326650 isoform X3 n=1 Tax=Styela clava TaxID=7725 RepID=UPI00193ADDC5|nr:uncharacterized protein LOC120326650 isoform X3 [Styela clava]
MAEGGQLNQQHQQNIYNFHVYNVQNQREIVQERTTTFENVAEEIGQINILQAEEQQNAPNVEEDQAAQQPGVQNVGQQLAADNVPPQNIAEGVDALNLSSRNNEASQIGAIKKKGRATALIGQTKFDKAATLLEELAQMQKCTELDTALMMVECYLQLEREMKGEKIINDVNRIIVTSSVDVKDIKIFAVDLISNSAYIRAIILLWIASNIYKAQSRSPDDAINGIESCVSKTYDATTPMIKAGGRSKIIGVDYGIKYMTEMLDDLRAIENADPVNKALKGASCSQYIEQEWRTSFN